jgi:hypothetical protein
MRHSFILTALLILSLPLAVSAAYAAKDPCLQLEQESSFPEINFSISHENLSHNEHETISNLQRRVQNPATGGATLKADHLPLGAMEANIKTSFNMGTAQIRLSNGQGCVAITSAQITLTFANPTIYMARELPRGSCIYREVLAHENRHVAVDKQLSSEYEYNLRNRVEAELRTIGILRGNSVEHASSQLQTLVQARLQPIFAEFIAERERRQALVDSADEYERISKSCKGQAQDILRKNGYARHR